MRASLTISGSTITPLQRSQRIERTVHHWARKLDHIWRGHEGERPALEWTTGRNCRWWSSQCGPPELERVIAGDIATLKRAEKRQLAADKATLINGKIAEREARQERNEMKKVIDSLLNRSRTSPSLYQLAMADGSLTCDPQAIHAELSRQYTAIWRNPLDSWPRQVGLEPDPDPEGRPPLQAIANWEKILEDPKELGRLYSDHACPIPRRLLDAIGAAVCTSPNRRTMEAEMDRVLHLPYSHKEMVKIIQHAPTTAPGLTGCSYQMMKYLPEAMTTKLFKLMHYIWRHGKTIPDFWRFKGLHGIPKASVPTITGVQDLRPLGLIEVTRKLWTKLVIHRIHRVISKHHGLQTQHCGGLQERGTDTALLQTLNMLEAMQADWDDSPHESDREIHLDFMSWDTRKAFDSIGNTVQYLAWRRMGVPAEVALWLISLDLGGRFIALTPYANSQLRRIKMKSATSRQHYLLLRSLGLIHDRGLTQGDIKSPLGWILVFDILITALNQCNHAKYPKAPIAGVHCYTLTPSVFLDDLTSLTSTRAHTQELAETISAFNGIFGTRFNPTKFRAMSTAADPTPVYIYDWQWQPQEVPLADGDATATVLGIELALGYKWTTQVQKVILKVRGIAKLMRASRAKPTTKAAVLVASTLESLTYVTSLSAWPLKQLQELRGEVSRLLVEVLHLPESHPHELLYAAVGGAGLTDIVEASLKARARILTRCMHGPWPACGAARGMMERAFPCERDAPEIRGTDHGALDKPPKDTYIAPLVSLLNYRLQLCKRGDRTMPQRVGYYLSDLRVPTEVKEFLNRYKVQFLEDLNHSETHEMGAWIAQENQLSPRGLQGLRQLLSTARRKPTRHLSPDHLLILRGGPYGQRAYFQVDGIIQDRLDTETVVAGLLYRKHQTPDDHDRGCLVTAVEESQRYLGVVRGDRITATQIKAYGQGIAFGMVQATAIRSTGPVGKSFRIMGENICPIQWVYPTCPSAHRVELAPWASTLVPLLERPDGGRPTTLATDAGSELKLSSCKDQFEEEATIRQASGAIVVDDDSAANRPSYLGPLAVIQVKGLPESVRSCNKAELLMLVAAMQLSWASGSIQRLQTDSQSTLTKLGKELRTPGVRALEAKPYAAAYRAIRAIKRKQPRLRLQFVKAHAERRRSMDTWTRAETLNFIADAYSTEKIQDTPDHIAQILGERTGRSRNGPRLAPSRDQVYEVQAKEVLLSMFPTGDYYWADRADGTPNIGPLFPKGDRILRRYLDTRAAKSVSEFPWNGLVTGALHRIWKKRQNVQSLRVKLDLTLHLWDKLDHSRNRAKGQEERQTSCFLCKDALEDQAHILLDCAQPAMRQLRTILRQDLMLIVEDTTARNRGYSYLRTLITWALPSQPPKEQTNHAAARRLSFLFMRPHRDDLTSMGPQEDNLTNAETTQFHNALQKIWVRVHDYVSSAWKLRNLLLAAPTDYLDSLMATTPTPEEVQLILKTNIQRQTKPRRKRKAELFHNGFTDKVKRSCLDRAPNRPPVKDIPRRHQLQPSKANARLLVTNKNSRAEAKVPEPHQEPVSEPELLGDDACARTNSMLIIGMARGKASPIEADARHNKYTGARQLAQAVEADNRDTTVVTMDGHHNPWNAQVDPNRHLRGNADNYNSARGGFASKWAEYAQGGTILNTIVINHLCGDRAEEPTWLPGGKFYSETLPGLATSNQLRAKGVVWLPATEKVRTALHSNLRTLLRLYDIELTDQITANPLQCVRNQAKPQTAATAVWQPYTGQLYRLVKLEEPGSNQQKRIRTIKSGASKRKNRSQPEQETGQEDAKATKRARALARLGVTTQPVLTDENQQRMKQTTRNLRPKLRGDTLGSRDLNYDITSDLIPGVQLTMELTEACQCEITRASPTHRLIVAASTIAGGGLGLFLHTGSQGIFAGGQEIDEYWGRRINTTETATRGTGEYCMAKGDYIIEADPRCYSGYMNDPFSRGNCFIRPERRARADGTMEIAFITTLSGPVAANTLVELTCNYGAGYWTGTRRRMLSDHSARQAEAFYGLATDRIRKRREVKPPTGIIKRPRTPKAPSGQTTQRNMLLLGMVANKEKDPHKGGQMYRDQLRCTALTQLNPEWSIYTLDNHHATDQPLVTIGRHCRANFNDWRRMDTAMDRDYEETKVRFEIIQLDYYWAPAGYVEERWGPSFFSDTLSNWAVSNRISIGGQIWLPDRPWVQKCLTDPTTQALLEPHFDIQLSAPAQGSPLVLATRQAQDLMAEAKDYHNEEPPQTLVCLTRKGPRNTGPMDKWIKTESTEDRNHQGRARNRGNAVSSSSRNIGGKRRKVLNKTTAEEKKPQERKHTITGWCVRLPAETEERRENEEHEEDASYHGTPPAGIG